MPKRTNDIAERIKTAMLPRIITREEPQTGKTMLIIDKQWEAMAPGKRLSKNRNIYYEKRKNRSDLSARNRI